MRAWTMSLLWLLGGAGVVAALFWAFLNTPESTVFTLAISAVLALAIYAVVGATLGGVLSGWASGWQGSFRRGAVAGVPALLPPLLLALAGWWMVGRGIDWVSAHSGEISAWFIGTLDWSDVRPLLNGAGIAGEWIRRVLVPFAAMVWLERLLTRGWRQVPDRDTLRHALSPWRLLLVTIVALVTMWAPVTYGLYWMPRGLPPTWVEPAVAVVKFGAMAIVGAVGLSLILRLAAPART